MSEKLHGRIAAGHNLAKIRRILSGFAPAHAAWLLVAFCSGLLFLRYPIAFNAGKSGLPSDFAVYLRAWERVHSGINPYVLSDLSPYKYSPGVLALVHLLPSTAAGAWLAFSAFNCLLIGFVLLLAVRYPTWKSVGLLILGVSLAWKGILETLDYGQLEILILGLSVIACAFQRRRPLLAGFLAGILPWIKLPWILLIFPLIVSPVHSLSGTGKKERRIRLLISGYVFSMFLWGAAIPSLLFGPERAMAFTRSWLELLKSQPSTLYTSDLNQSLWVTLARWAPGHLVLCVGTVAVLGGIVMARLVRRSLIATGPRESLGWITPWLILTQLLNPLSWRWGSVFLLGAPFAAVSTAVPGHEVHFPKWKKPVAFFLALLWLLQLNPVVKLFGFHHWSGLHGYGLITVYWALALALTL